MKSLTSLGCFKTPREQLNITERTNVPTHPCKCCDHNGIPIIMLLWFKWYYYDYTSIMIKGLEFYASNAYIILWS